MKKISSDYLFPINQAPIFRGILILDDQNTVLDIINPEVVDYTVQDVKIYKGFICPGFVNTHCHLELSYLKNQILENTGLHNFIIEVQRLKMKNDENIQETIALADIEMTKNGIVAVGDVSNNMDSFEIKKNSKIYYHTFIEVFGSNPNDAEAVFNHAIKLANKYFNDHISIVPHSPYAVSKELFSKIKAYAIENNSILCMHHQENEDENDFFKNRDGNIFKRLQLLGVDYKSFNSTGFNSLASVSEFLPNNNPILMVHNTVSESEDIAFAENYFKNLWWCFCPSSNLFIENKLPNFQLFKQNENNITLGTDSLASNKSLSILEEIKKIQLKMPEMELNTLLKWGTYNGANYLKLENTLGSFEKGKKPGVNLIEKIDLMNLKLSAQSSVKVLISQE